MPVMWCVCILGLQFRPQHVACTRLNLGPHDMLRKAAGIAKKPACAVQAPSPEELYVIRLCNAFLYYTIPYYTILHYTTLYYTILHYTTLYYTVLYQSFTLLRLGSGCLSSSDCLRLMTEQPRRPKRVYSEIFGFRV